jgi:signal transduction histidine kinase
MKKQQSSITSLLMLGVLSATLLYSLIFASLVYTQTGGTIEYLRDRSLADQAYVIADYLNDHADMLNMPASADALNGAGMFQYVVRDSSSGHIVLHSKAAELDGFPNASPEIPGNQYFSFYGPHGSHFLGASIPYSVGRHDYFIQVAQDETSIKMFSDILTKTFFQRISLFGIPFLFLLMLIIALSIKLIMSPLTRGMKQAGEISFAKPDIRLEEDFFPKEIQPLAHAVNAALDRIEAGITAQKDFIANAAHELRTPLSVLRTHVDLLQDKEAAARMRDDVDSMARLVSQLLDTARLESPELLDMHRIDLAEVLKAASQTIWPLMVKENRAFEVEGVDRPCYIEGNFDALFRALRNVLENTLTHTPKGSAVELTLKSGVVTVRDHGQGVPPEDREKIFGKFSRKDVKQGAAAGNGAGLGLFIVKRIMDLHGGEVMVADAPGGGGMFILKFPRQD